MADILPLISAALDRSYHGVRLGVAVSGGGDSVALLLVIKAWSQRRGVRVHVATVDHGLRPESAAEAEGVASLAKRLGISCDILRWGQWDGVGNLQAEARAARRRLLTRWAARRGVSAIALGHTMDDQAETVLMRLGRGAGVDGLSAMNMRTAADGVVWLRPMLGVRRAALRDWLVANGESWVDDPSNDDLKYERVKARRALGVLADLGISAEGLSATAERMQSARTALDDAAATLASEAAKWGACGELRLSLKPLRAAPRELTRRLLRAGLTRAAGAEYGPRADAEAKLLSAIMSLRLGGGRSLHGCLVRPEGVDRIVIAREAAAVCCEEISTPRVGDLWDGRFRIDDAETGPGAVIAPLGEAGARRLNELAASGAWSAPESWREAPRAARLTTPALWRENLLAAAPLAAYGEGLRATFVGAFPGWAEPPQAA
ncbi:MAG: tRNA lysidine(34) synthetase TilS [Pikeienuella sp.]